MQLSENMSQDLSQWYREQQALHPDMDAPELWSTVLSDHQREVRAAMISQWAQAKRDDIRQEISASLREPDLVDVSRTSVGGEGDVRAAYRPHGIDAIRGDRDGGNPDAAATIIAAERRAIGEEKTIAEAGRASRMQGAVNVESEVGDSHNKGFFLHPRLRE